MKDFIKKNKFFMTLLAIMIIITAALVVYDVQKWYKSALPNEDNKEYKSQVKKQLRSQALPVIINACKAGIYYMFNGITAKQRIRWKAYI